MPDIVDPAALRAHYGEPNPRARAKQLARLDRHARHFIGLSPLVVIASSDASGRSDASPRGDAPGFVAVADDSTLVIPDRPGNRRVDTLSNVTENPHVGLLFMVPGLDETLRVNGRARITTDVSVLTPLAVRGKVPGAGLIVAIESAYFHCGKALIRARLWHEDAKVDRSQFPSLGRVLAEQIGDMEVADSETAIEQGYRTKLY